jgi:hypothetical protein
MNIYPPVSSIYTFVWAKYRPAILKLMTDSANGPQCYKFSDHEFRRIKPSERNGYHFLLQVFKGKATNDIRHSEVAKDLLLILQQSDRALALTWARPYEFRFDKQFVLHITVSDKKVAVNPEQPVML